MLKPHDLQPAPGSKKRPKRVGRGIADIEVTSEERNGRKIREGLVVSTAMEKTIVVAVTERVRHARYFKTVPQRKNHDGRR